MKVKYVAWSLAMQKAMWLRSILLELNLTPRVDGHVEMLCDNTTSIQLAKDPKSHWKTRHREGAIIHVKRHKNIGSFH